MKLSAYLQTQSGIGSSSIVAMETLFARRNVAAKELILSENSHCRNIYFVEKGLLRLYFYEDRKEITQEFYVENTFYAPVENIFLNVPFTCKLETVTSSVLRMAGYDAVWKAVHAHAGMQEFIFYRMTQLIKSLSDRIYDIRFRSAGERYQLLLSQRPEILQHAALGHIASYLGMTPQTLSMVRKELTVRSLPSGH